MQLRRSIAIFSTNKTQNSVFTLVDKVMIRYLIPEVVKPYTITSSNIFHGVDIETSAIIVQSVALVEVDLSGFWKYSN